MPIIRTKKQSTQTLEEFYEFLANENEMYCTIKDNMVNLINKINSEFPERTFYALTSHSRLVVLDSDETSSDWLVIFSTHFPDEYGIDAMLPDETSIWKNSRVTTEVKGVDNAVDCFRKALDNLKK